jgi:hypothetical protein
MAALLQRLIRDNECTLYHDYRSGDLQDKSGNGYHGVGNSISLSKEGLRPTVYGSGYVTVADCALFDSNKYGTIFVLVKNQGSATRNAWLNYTCDSGEYVAYYTSSSNESTRYRFEDSANTTFTGLFNISETRTHSVVFENGTLSTYYTDGSYFDVGNTNNNFGTLNNGDLVIGNNGSLYTDATIQAVFVTKTKLTASEISQLHNELSSLKWPSKPITNTSARSLIDLNATGLVSAYDFRNGSLTDLKGSNNGTQYGSLDFVRDRFGSGVRGDANGAIRLGASGTFDTQDNFFCSFWMKPNTHASAGWVFNLFEGTSDAFGFRINTDDTVEIYDDIDNANASRYNTSISIGRDTHIAFGINDSKLCKLWIDGQPASNDEHSSALFSVLNGDYILGARATTLASPFNGTISNVEIYNTDLTDSDVQAIYSRGQRIKSFFDRGLIASGKTFSSGFIENSGLFINSGSFKIDTDGTSKY